MIKSLKRFKSLPFLHLKAASVRHIDPDQFRSIRFAEDKRILIIDNVITFRAALWEAAATLKREATRGVSAPILAAARELFLPASGTRI